jgi:Asp-tRNA(Asn)/Glu-tRNA(Gln) amidotransferase A subunit family amidase
MSELCEMSACELRTLIGNKTVSPVEVFESCVRRIERSNPWVNAIVTMDLERAEERAQAAEQSVMKGARLGLLHGLPAAIKDLNSTAGLRTTFGSRIYREHVPTEDDAVAASLRSAGAIILGKTNTPEFGAGANTTNLVFGATHNPYAHGRIVGGSSGGAAAALATRMVPIANGSDRGGSLRIPASFCGVVGFRPSSGMIPFDDRVIGWSPLCVEGPLGRNVRDARLLFDAMRRTQVDDQLSTVPPEISDELTELSGLRVAFSEDLGFAPVDDAVRNRFTEIVDRLQAPFKRCRKAHPDFAQGHETFEVLRALDFMASYKDYYDRNRSELTQNVVVNVEQGLGMTLEDVARAMRAQTTLFRQCTEFFTRFDLLICPTVAVTPFDVKLNHPPSVAGLPARNYFHWFALTYGITLTALPAISIPCGMLDGTPFGIQLVGSYRSDLRLLAWAEQIERLINQHTELAVPPPGMVATVE